MPQSSNVLRRVRTKRTSKADLRGPLQKYVKRVYGDHVAQEMEDSLEALQELRAQIVSSASASSPVGNEHYAKYYHALRAIEIRFPVSADSSHVNVTFKWHDAFVDSHTCSQKNIHFEKAGVLFCMAALESQKGAEANRDTRDGIAEAAKAFSLAAGIFKYMREEVVLKTDTPRSTDISGECCAMLEELMLAQAQEMFYEMLSAKKAADGAGSAIKLATLAAVAWSVSELYEAAHEAYLKPQLVRHVQREWGESSKTKALLYKAEAHYMQAQHCEENPDLQGTRCGHLEHACKLIADGQTDIRQASTDLQKQVKELHNTMMAASKAAHKENMGIYMQAVPGPGSLPRIEGKRMVAPKSPEDGLLQRSEEWFRDIVPDKVTRNLSRYTSQMEDVVRGLMQKLETATDDTRTALATHGLPDVLDAMNPGYRPELPENAKVALAEDFVRRGVAGQLPSMVDTLQALRDQAMMELRHCGEVLDEEQAQDEAMRGRHGEQWSRPPSRVAAASYRENIARYEANLQAAGESDARNQQRLAAVQPRLAKLSPEGVRGMLPRLQAPMVSPGIDADDVTSKLRHIIAQLDALGQERAALEEALRTKREGDNVLPELLQVGAGGEERVFAAHLASFRQAEGPIEQNAARTNEALALLREYVAAFRRLYDVDDWQAQCQRVGEAVREDVRVGNDLVAQLGEGVTFYTGMQDHVAKLRQLCADYVMARNLDRDRRAAELQRAAASHGDEDLARRFHQMDVAYGGAQHGQGAPPPAAHTPQPPQPHMYPQQSAPARAAPSPYSLYPPPAPPPQGPPAPGPPAHHHGAQVQYGAPMPYGGGQQAAAPPPHAYQQPGQYYQSQMYPQPPPR